MFHTIDALYLFIDLWTWRGNTVDTQKIFNYSQMTLQYLLDLIFPPQCGGCRRGGSVLCSSCITQFMPIYPPLCQHCNSPLTPDGSCQSCHYHKLGLSGLRIAYTFKDPLRTCIHSLKYQGNV